MSDESFYFLKVGDLGRRTVVSCAPDDDILRVADLMRDRRVSGVVVCHEDEPVGIITDRDFRTRLREIAQTSGKLRAADLMSSPVTTIGEGELVFEAIYQMGKNRIHRLVVVDALGKLAGIITDADLIKLQLTTPMYLGRDVEEAQSLKDLAEINAKAKAAVSHAFRAGGRSPDVIRLISHLHDSIAEKVIAILLRNSANDVPESFAFLALGSEGRGEQTLKTDQDNAIVYADELTEKEIVSLAAFSEKLIDALVYIGVPPCPGGTMASNPEWRRSLSDWSLSAERWIRTPSPEGMVSFGMFCDLRTLYGRPEYERSLKEIILAAVRQNALFLAYMARNILRFPPPIGLFGRLKGERSGEHKGAIDLKKAGIFAITEGATLLALEIGLLDGGTRVKIGALKGHSALSDRDLDRVLQAYDFLSHLRLHRQLSCIQEGFPPDNYIYPTELSPDYRGRLKEALAAVELLQRHLKDQYHLNQIPH